jgi:hypothetical protein
MNYRWQKIPPQRNQDGTKHQKLQAHSGGAGVCFDEVIVLAKFA